MNNLSYIDLYEESNDEIVINEPSTLSKAGDWVADHIEEGVMGAYVHTLNAATRTERLSIALVKATPDLRKVAKAKADARMAQLLKGYGV